MHAKAFGCFLPPFHDPSVSPYAALKRDIELSGLADDLGFDEIWLGEHHSSGWSTLSAPEMLIAALARETHRIRLATGVIPLPYHHPLHVAERMVLLDHLTDGRAILGVGTGTYVHDMEMIGVDPSTLRANFRASLDVVQALLRGETVDTTTPWFTAKKAVLQLRPLRGSIETVVASSLSDPAIEMLADTATTPTVHVVPPWGAIRPGMDKDPVGAMVERVDAYRNKSGGDTRVRCNVFVHVADSAAAGIDELLPGFSDLRRGLYKNILGMPIPDSPVAHRKTMESLVDSGAFIVGDTATCTRMISDLLARLGDPVSLNFFVPRWVSHQATLDQLTALSHEVLPGLYGALDGTAESMKLTAEEAARQMKRRTEIG
ncbi:LLM class flavin-dependent oxidoreductase [Allokutzneria sp. A3M-2-11 16]|uniref:LLM class flavin-dependent oxidoreductase n=1 Tax=Allokutzneria sp. A3M-2-11 16 TaxID=2962043 RepID=UPI0020B67261|nr:LLM class flavin-dependent oxidoreductase [Allokutzneria sp. A3M-2-11 16]MCP3800882.1 LLM class flavin-dependent oxidoreductase [Allokutzneria sp. A3M-2-11 16]